MLSAPHHCHALQLDGIGEEGAAMQDALRDITGGRTVPRVFVDGGASAAVLVPLGAC